MKNAINFIEMMFALVTRAMKNNVKVYSLLALVFVGMGLTTSAQTVTLANNGTQVTALNVAQGSANWVLQKFQITVSVSGFTAVSGLSLTTAGTYAGSDITNLKLYYSNSSAFNINNCTLIGTIASPGAAGIKTFPSIAPLMYPSIVAQGTGQITAYYYITADVASSAVTGRTISVNALTTANFTLTSGLFSGSATAGGTQTIADGVLSDNGTQITGTTVAAGATDWILHQSAITCGATARTLTGLNCTTGGSYVLNDITNLKVYYSPYNAFTASTATLLSTIAAPAAAGAKTFSSFTSQLIAANTVGYIYIVADVAPGIANSKSISISALTTANFSFSPSGIPAGSTTAGGSQTTGTITATLADNTPQVTSSSVAQGATNVLLHQSKITFTNTTRWVAWAISTAGNYTAGDISNIKVYTSNNNTFAAGGLSLFGSFNNPGNARAMYLPVGGFTQSNSGTVYIYITADIAPGATLGNTISANAISNIITAGTGTTTGSTTNGGAKTITANPTPTITLANNGSQPGAANIPQGATTVLLHKSAIASASGYATVTGLTCTTTGTYQSSDISNLKVYYSTSSSFSVGTATVISTLSSVPTAGLQTFPSIITQYILAGTTGYYFITADIAAGAIAGNTLSVGALTTSDFTIATGSFSGSTSGGGLQTIAIAPSVVISDNSPQIVAAGAPLGNTNWVCHKTALTVTSANATLTGMTCNVGGNATSQTFNNLRLYYSSSSTFSVGTSTLLSTLASISNGVITFPSFTSQLITAGTTGYLYVTANVTGTTNGRTIQINAFTPSNFTFSLNYLTATGFTSDGGVQTPCHVALTDNSPQAPAGVVAVGTTVVLHQSMLNEGSSAFNLTGIACTTAGSYSATDLTNLKVWYQTTPTFTGSGTVLSTLAPVAVAGNKIFPSFTSQALPTLSNSYIFITADVAPGATVGKTININAIPTGSYTISGATISGSTTLGGTQTFSASGCNIPASVSVGSITSNSASVSFTCASCTGSYTVEYGPVGFTPGVGATAGAGGTVVTGTGSPIILSGLSISTNYQVYVRQNCSGVFSGNSTVVAFSTTSCATPTVSCGGVNLTCLGATNGSASVTLTAGTAPFAYLWSNGNTTSAISGLSTGTYSVTVTNACGSSSCSYTVANPPPFTATGNVTNVSCLGGGNGAVALTVSGGTAPYNYAWSNGETTQNITGLLAGTYMVTVTATGGCTTVSSVQTVTEPAAALSGSIIIQNNVTCFGNSSGNVSVQATGGTTPYRYNIGAGYGTPTTGANLFGSLVAGTYNVTILDGTNTCTAIVPVTITQPLAALNGTISGQTNVDCFGNNTGSVTVTGSDGTSPYQYALGAGPFSGTNSFSSLVAGTYIVTVKDANLCSQPVTVVITQPTALNGAISGQTNVACFGGNTGSVTVNGSNGTSPYQYALDAGIYSVSNTFNALTAGSYTVTIKDAHQCLKAVPVVITEPATTLDGVISGQTNVLCFGNNTGNVTVTGSDGTGPYQYALDAGTYSVTNTFNNLTAGTYTVTVKDANLCTKPVTVGITQPAAPLSGSIVSHLNILCFQDPNTGSVEVQGVGGTSPYQYKLDNGSYGSATVGSNTFSSLAEGTYTVTISDANSCTTTVSSVITRPLAALIALPTYNDPACDGSPLILSANASGGSGGNMYSWSGPNGTITPVSNSTITIASEAHAGDAGTYSVIITDQNNCSSGPHSVVVEIHTTPSGALFANTDADFEDTICAGSGATLMILCGGTGTISGTLWDGVSTTLASYSGVQNQINIAVIPPVGMTMYYLQSMHDQYCSARNVDIIGVDPVTVYALSGPAVDITTPATTELTCTTTSILLETTTDISSTYLWTPNGETTEDITVTLPGTYVVTGTETSSGYGCIGLDQIVITQNITPPVLTIDPPATTELNCTVISILLNTSGTSVSYIWNTGATTSSITVSSPGTYSVTSTGANGCTNTTSILITQSLTNPTAGASSDIAIITCTNPVATLTATGGVTYLWSNGSANAVTTVTTAGTYTVIVTAANGCSDNASVFVGQDNTSPTATASSDIATITCTNPVATLTATGGGTYLWSNGSTDAVTTVTTGGTYTVTVTIANGCTDAASVVVGFDKTVPAVASSDIATITCTNPIATLTATGGISYLWSTGSTDAVIIVAAGGTYTVTVTAANGCTGDASVVVGFNKTVSAGASSDIATITCANPVATLTATGGVDYLWSNGSTNAVTTVTTSGTYSVFVTAANGCTDNASVVVGQDNTAPTATASSDLAIITCTSPIATLTATGGGSYMWSNGITDAITTVTTGGTYTVIVTSANGCTNNASVVVGQDNTPPSAAASSDIANITCTNPVATLTASGGGSYLWSNGSTDAVTTVTTGGTYTVTVTSANGCTNAASVTVGFNKTIIAGASSNIPAITCANPIATLTATGGVSYLWSNGSTNAVTTTATTGTYTVTVTAANGCSDDASVFVDEVITQPSVSIAPPATTILTCTTPSISLNASGSGVSYIWSNGVTTASTSVSLPGTYTVTSTGANGCTNTASIVITEDVAVTAGITNNTGTTILTCTMPSISLTATGGTSYLWSSSETIDNINVSSPGTYTVTVTAANGCTAVASIVITQNIAVTAGIINNTGTTILNCVVTSISLTATGGVSYLWSTAETTTGISVTTAGTYSVTATAANGCTATQSLSISQDNGPTATASNSASAGVCEPTTLTLNTSAATNMFSYMWTGPGSKTSGQIYHQNFNLLPSTAGTTTVWTDNETVPGWYASYTGFVSGTSTILATTGSTTTTGLQNYGVAGVNPVTDRALGVFPTSSSTPAGTGTVYIGVKITNNTGTTVDRVYVSYHGETYRRDFSTKTLAFNYGINNPDIITGTYTPVTALNFSTSVNNSPAATDGNSSSYSASLASTITVSLLPGQSIWLRWNETQSTQMRGYSVDDVTAILYNSTATLLSAAANPTSGTAFSASGLTTDDAYTITGATNAANNGIYTLTAFSNVNCSQTATTTAAINALPTAGITNNTGTTILTCSNPSISLTATGGATYLWNTGATTDNISVSSPGTYSVIVTSAGGCTGSTSLVITQNNTQPTATASSDIATISCTNPVATLTATGGGTYLWSNGSTDAVTTVTSGGTYTVTVTSANSCTDDASVVVGQNNTAPTATASSDIAAITCANPVATLTATGGGTYLWSNGSTNAVTTVTTGGTYTVVVTAANGCPDDASAVVGQDNTTPTATITPSGATTFCTGGSVTLDAGAAGYSGYLWSNSATTQTVLVSTSGTYTVTVTSANGCTATSAVTTVTVNICNTALNLKLYIQGYYSGSGLMQPVLFNQTIGASGTETDTILVELRDEFNTSNVIASAKGLLMTNGTVLSIGGSGFEFSGAHSGNYWIAVKHRNALETWSSSAVSFATTPTYDFSSAANKALYDNQALVDGGMGLYGFYSGDIIADGFIGIDDVNLTNNDNLAGLFFDYLATDINGDGFVGIDDVNIVNNNNLAGVFFLP